MTLRSEIRDRRLPAAALLLDPSTACPLIERALRSGADPSVRLDGCTARSVRYVYGSRCTVVYELSGTNSGAVPAVVVAKAHVDGAGARVDAAMRALWATPLSRGDVVRLAEPLGYLPDPGVLVQSAVPGDLTVRELLAGGGRESERGRTEEVLRHVADGLVALHGCLVPDGPLCSWADDVERVHRTAARIAPGWPSAAEEIGSALDVLERAAATSRTATGLRPGHGAFRPSQVLVDGDRVGFVDFDGFCLAEPERDLGRFCKALRKSVIGPAGSGDDLAGAVSRAERLVDVLLSRYAQGAPMSMERVTAWEALDELAGHAHRVACLRRATSELGDLAAEPA